MRLQKSKFAFIVAGIFIFLAVAALFMHLYSVRTNPGDSGESGIVMLPFSVPWILMVPSSVAYSRFWAYGVYSFYFACVSINALILYILTGGMRWRK